MMKKSTEMETTRLLMALRGQFVASPMVDYSERAFRLLCARLGASLVFTPMLNARLMADEPAYGHRHFDPHPSETGRLVAQLAGHDPSVLRVAAQRCEPHVCAIDLNLGCPQDIARRGRYGAFLLEEERELAIQCVAELTRVLEVPVTAKLRLLPTEAETLDVVLRLQDAGASAIHVHGRTRRMTTKLDGVGQADWGAIRKLVTLLEVRG